MCRCKACDLYLHATQAVPGSGPRAASVVFIGEQPGIDEDLQGLPFVGPAGKLLNRALAEAGIDRTTVYLTNVVKHFKFEERGKRRIHKKPNTAEIAACRPWLEAEMSLIKPKLIVCMGATASQALLGSAYRLTKEHGKFTTRLGSLRYRDDSSVRGPSRPRRRTAPPAIPGSGG